MPDTRTTPSAPPQNGESFLTPATLRQPADALGPRAQRTIVRIIEATREVFLTRGYSGTTIDEIARVADVSRASFYTYFPSKREVLLAVGAERRERSAQALIDRFPEHARSRSGLRGWVLEYFAAARPARQLRLRLARRPRRRTKRSASPA